MPIEKNHYICIPAIDIDSVLIIDKRSYPQAYLEQCKYKLKEKKPVNFIDFEIIDDDRDDDNENDDNDNDEMMIMKMILLHLNNHKNYDYF